MSDILSSINAHSILQANASSNIANQNSKEYQALRTTLSEGKHGGVEVVTERDSAPGVVMGDGTVGSNVDLAREFSDMMRARTGFESSLSAIKVRDEMLADLMDVFKKVTS